MDFMFVVPAVILAGGGLFFLGWLLNARIAQNRMSSAKEVAKKILADAEKEAETLKREKLLEVKDEWYSKKKEFDSDIQSKKSKVLRHGTIKCPCPF